MSVVVLLTAAFATLAPYHDPAPPAPQTQAASAKPQVAIAEIWLEQNQVALANLGGEPVQLLDADGNVAFDLSFAVRPGQVESEEFTPVAGTYTLSHQAHGHPIKGTVVVK